MTWKRLHLPAVGGFFLLFLALALAGQGLYEERWVWQPLTIEMERVAGVEQVEIDHEQQPPMIEVRLQANVDLPQVYRRLESVASRRLGPATNGGVAKYAIAISDQRTPQLMSAYDHLRFAVEEAIATGRFTGLTVSVARAKEEAGLSQAEVWVDRENVYLHLKDAKGWLYAVVPRSRGTPGLVGMGEGGAADVEA